MDNIAAYLVRNQKQIFKYLIMLEEERCLISVVFGEEEKDTFLTAIMDIDEKNKTMTIDCGPKEYLNKKLLDSAVIKYSSRYKGVDVFFKGRKITKAGKLSNPEFTIPIPGSIYWIQRRDFFRVKSPLSKNSYCRIYFKDPETEFDFKIHDLSVNGFSILSDTPEFSSNLIPAAEFEDCKLVLENEETQTISFTVQNKHPLNPSKPEKTKCIGCHLTNTSPRIESTIMRYMQNIERENKLIAKKHK
jgi:c-di-GMP-binding flagellar brake protein YcgR